MGATAFDADSFCPALELLAADFGGDSLDRVSDSDVGSRSHPPDNASPSRPVFRAGLEGWGVVAAESAKKGRANDGGVATRASLLRHFAPELTCSKRTSHWEYL